ncbi:MAG: manganese ABC transporter permease [Chloroflexota bacterium]
MMDWLLLPLQQGFMQRGLVAAVMVAIVCSLVGTYVVLRSMSFIGDAMAHAILPGVAAAFLSGGHIFVGAFLAGLFVAFAIGLISRTARLREDAAIGVVFVGAFALGVLLISTARGYTVDLAHILFGNVLGVSPEDLVLIALVGGVVLVLLFVFRKELLLLSFDPTHGSALGLPMDALNYGFLVLLALTIVIAMRTVGNILSVAMLITPAATAYLLTDRLRRMLLIAAGVGTASALVGLYLSYYLNVASGAAIVVTATAFFLIALLFSPRSGLLAR